MDNSGSSLLGKSGKLVALRQAGRAEKHAKWPDIVKFKKADVFEGYRQMVLPHRRFRYFWRSKKGMGFWVTAKGMAVFQGRTLREATIRMVASLPEYQEMDVA